MDDPWPCFVFDWKDPNLRLHCHSEHHKPFFRHRRLISYLYVNPVGWWESRHQPQPTSVFKVFSFQHKYTSLLFGGIEGWKPPLEHSNLTCWCKQSFKSFSWWYIDNFQRSWKTICGCEAHNPFTKVMGYNGYNLQLQVIPDFEKKTATYEQIRRSSWDLTCPPNPPNFPWEQICGSHCCFKPFFLIPLDKSFWSPYGFMKCQLSHPPGI